MKFGKRLKRQIEETLPEWRDKFLSYKDLKKRVKFISTVMEASASLDKEEIKCESCGEASQGSKKRRIISDGALDTDGEVDSDSASTSVDISKNNSSNGSNQDAGCKDLELFNGNMTVEESDFVQLLNAEIEKFNAFFMEQEEEYIIRQKELRDRIVKVKNQSGPNGKSPSETDYNEEMIKVRKDIVNFHGEMVLLENYSALNYTGLVKILKKYDKRTGGLLRHPFIQRVLQQPFFTTEQLSKLVRDCENTLQSLFPDYPPIVDDAEVPASQPNYGKQAISKLEANALSQGSEDENVGAAAKAQGEEISLFCGEDVESIYRNTMAALRTMTEMRKGSSTYSVFSLPPLHNNGEIVDEKKSIPLCSLIPICPKN
eukprot:Gb_06615 [translate_table: standard]